jgi:transposase
MEEIGIWPRFGGRAMHDRLSSYDKYAGAHSLCRAHLLRDCIYLAEQQEQAWAAEMVDHLLAMHQAAHEGRLRRASCVPAMERDEWLAHSSLSKSW